MWWIIWRRESDRIISKIEKRFSLSKKQAEEYFAEFSENFVKNYL